MIPERDSIKTAKVKIDTKRTARGIVAKFFKRDVDKPSDILREVNSLTELDLIQLASAIVRSENIPLDELANELALNLAEY